MRKRVTIADLESQVAHLNELTGIVRPQWNTPGAYVLSGAYGGWKLTQVVNDAGGTRDITSGFVPKRELYGLVGKYIAGRAETSR